MVDPFRWACRYCNHPQVVTDHNYFRGGAKIRNPEAVDLGLTAYTVRSIVCQNEACGRMTLGFELHRREDTERHDGYKNLDLLRQWSLLPDSSAKPQPSYIPAVLVADYEEACKICDLSPKASATLARRCLQGMIRDFCQISKQTLDQEIRALRKAVEEHIAPTGVSIESVDGIDAVRKVGNIGAHMEADVNMIVDIEPGEARVLIELIETLFDEWYIARHRRQQRFATVKALADTKQQELAKLKSGAGTPSGSNKVP